MKTYTLKPLTPANQPPLPQHLVAELNPAQLEAVQTLNGPVLVIAGAGSGKTKTLVSRVANLIHQGVDPKQILLLTFTRKSAQEMLYRATRLLDERCGQVAGGTFHSFATTVLRRHAKALGFSESFTILDRGDSEDLINYCRNQASLDKGEKRFPKKGTIASIFSKALNTEMPLATIVNRDYPQFTDFIDTLLQLYGLYIRQKQLMQVMDYDDLLVHLLTLLNEHPDIATALQNRYRYIMVDEYQDTNRIQAEIIVKLASAHGNIMVVGDDAQSIYSFRGAHFKNIMAFPNLFKHTKIITLEQNYRSTQPILDLTNAIIAQAKESYTKTLFSDIPSDDKPIYIETDSDHMQSRFVCQKILELREEGVPLSDIAVLIRSGWHSNDLEIELKAHGLPFAKFGGFKFVEAAHVKDLMAYFRVMFNPIDAISWQRILLLLEGVGPKAVSQFIDALPQILQNPDQGLLPFRSKGFYKTIAELVQLIQSEQGQPADRLEAILEHYTPLFKRTYDDYTKRQSDLDSLKNIAQRYTNLEQFLTELSLDPPDQSQLDSLSETQDDEKITISTIHSAKGLEWNTVFALSLVDGYLPSFQSLGDLDQIEEERRLLYVSLTRAKRRLFLLKPHLQAASGQFYRYSGMQFSKVSRFLGDRNLLEHYAEKWALVEDQHSVQDTTIDISHAEVYADDPPTDGGSRRRYYF
ncbi:MAG: ATP-dependent helicase [Candidatus Margulisiibacteriota bacterium]